MTEPAVLLLDEPLSNLDLKLREHMRGELRRILKSLGMTAIYVTHDQSDAMVLSDRLVVMVGGKVSESGTPRSVYDRPRTLFGSQFVGASNVFHATASRDKSGTVEATLDDGAVLTTAVTPGDARWTHLMIRPEQIVLTRNADGYGENVLQGTVSEMTFLGNVTLYRVECGTYSILVQAAADTAELGDRLFLWLPPQHLHPIVDEDTA